LSLEVPDLLSAAFRNNNEVREVGEVGEDCFGFAEQTLARDLPVLADLIVVSERRARTVRAEPPTPSSRTCCPSKTYPARFREVRLPVLADPLLFLNAV
jgi:hypothetical protein